MLGLSPDQIDQITSLAQFVVVIVVGTVLSVLVVKSQKRRQADEAMSHTITAQAAQISVLTSDLARAKEAADRMGKELREGQNAAASETGRLAGQVDQLRAENDALRKLVMLDTVPQPLMEALKTLASEIGAAMERELHPIQQGMTRLLVGGQDA